MKILVVVLVGVVLLIVNGNITFGSWSGADEPQAGSSEAPKSRVVRDVLSVMDAATVEANDLDDAQMSGLVTRVITRRDPAASRLLARELPQLSRRLDHRIRTMYAAVARTHVSTAIGRKCRATTLRFLTRQRLLFRQFAHHVARHGAPPPFVDGFAARAGRVQTWYANGIRSCMTGAAPDERAAIVSG
jgi:hypothetical protein